MRLLGTQVAQARGTEHVEKESPAEQEAPVVTETRTPAPRPRLTANRRCARSRSRRINKRRVIGEVSESFGDHESESDGSGETATSEWRICVLVYMLGLTWMLL